MSLKEIFLDSCASTNDELKKLALAGATEGSFVQSRIQTSGRGQKGRVWVSEPGNLFFSFLVEPKDSKKISWISIAAGIAVAEALEKIAGPELQDRRITLKWPNDLGLLDKSGIFLKAGGILCEGVAKPDHTFVVVGLGINTRFKPMLSGPQAQPVASLGVLEDFSLPENLKPLIGLVLSRVNELLSAAPTRLTSIFFERSLFKVGSEIEFDQVKNETTSGTVLGLGEFGQLRVEIQGKTKELLSEEIRVRAQRASQN